MNGQITRFLILCLALGGFSPWAAAEGPEQKSTLGELGNPDQIVLEGLKFFPEEEVRRALFSNVKYWIGAHPRASRSAFPEFLKQKLELGLRQSGCPQGTADVAFDAERCQFVARIQEGPQWLRGGVKIIGAEQIDRTKLLHWITVKPPQPKPEATVKPATDRTNALWTRGEPASFVEDTWKHYDQDIAVGMRAQGFYFAKLQTRVEAEADGTATLVVQIQDEGPLAVIGKIVVEGLERNTTDELLDSLKLQTGMLFNLAVQERVTQALADSARFVVSSVSVDPPTAEDAAPTLRIVAREYPHAPVLGSPLSERQRHLVQVFRIVQRFNPKENIRATAEIDAQEESGMTFKFRMDALDQQHGLGEWSLTQADGTVALRQALALQPTEYILASVSGEQRLTIPRKKLGFGVKLSLAEQSLPQPPFRAGTINFGFPFHFTSSAGKTAKTIPLLDFEFDFAPVAALVWAEDPEVIVRNVGDAVEVRRDSMTIVADISHSRLRAIRYEDSESHLKFALETIEDPAQTARQINRAVAQLIRLPAEQPYPSSMGGVARFLISDIVATFPDRLTALQKAGLRLAPEILTMVEQTPAMLFAEHDEVARRFNVPVDGDVTPGLKMGAMSIGLAGRVVPRPSWLWTICREVGLAMSGESKFLLVETQSMFGAGSSAGPVTHLVGAYLFRKLNKAQLSEMLAKQGLENLTLAMFRSEFQPLIGMPSPLQKLIFEQFEALRQLSDDDLRALLADWLPSGDERQSLVDQCVRRIRGRRGSSIAVAVSETLVLLWPEVISPHLKSALESYTKAE